MKKHNVLLVTAAIIVLLLFTWIAVSVRGNDRSNGKLQDRGSRFLVNRYVMNLGTIDLSQSQEKHFRVEGLPADRQFVLGLNIYTGGDCAIQNSDVRIALKMTNEQGLTVIDEKHPLREFTWATNMGECFPAFAYIRGKAKEIKMNEKGDVCMQPIYTGADSGQGSYFVSRKFGIYNISVKVYDKSFNLPGSHLAKVMIEDNGARNASVSHCP